MSTSHLNLTRVTALLADSDSYMLQLTGQMLRGLGLDRQVLVRTGEAARNFLKERDVNLCFIESRLSDMSGYDLIKWLRSQPGRNRFTPVIVLTGLTQPRTIAGARDCGANMVLRKPMSPQTLFDHIKWVAASKRPFVEVGDYIGPDRRFKSEPLPGGVGRRSTDTQSDAAAARDNDMSDQEIDALLKPKKAAVS